MIDFFKKVKSKSRKKRINFEEMAPGARQRGDVGLSGLPVPILPGGDGERHRKREEVFIPFVFSDFRS